MTNKSPSMESAVSWKPVSTAPPPARNSTDRLAAWKENLYSQQNFYSNILANYFILKFLARNSTQTDLGPIYGSMVVTHFVRLNWRYQLTDNANMAKQRNVAMQVASSNRWVSVKHKVLYCLSMFSFKFSTLTFWFSVFSFKFFVGYQWLGQSFGCRPEKFAAEKW